MEANIPAIFCCSAIYAVVDGASRTRHEERRTCHMKTVKLQPQEKKKTDNYFGPRAIISRVCSLALVGAGRLKLAPRLLVL